MHRTKLVLLGLAAVVFALALVAADDFPRMAAYLPRFVAGAGLLACLAQLAEELVLLRRVSASKEGSVEESSLEGTGVLSSPPIPDAVTPPSPEVGNEAEAPPVNPLAMMGMLYLYVVCVVLFGLLYPSGVLLAASFRFRARVGWFLSVAGSAVVLFAVWQLASVSRIRLPQGILLSGFVLPPWL